jgi:serine/threonine protein kinase
VLPLRDEKGNVGERKMKGLEGTKFGRYELWGRIAQGGMSEVFLGYDRRVRRQVAIKVLYGSDESFVRRIEREALAVGALSHDHILPLYDFGEQRPWYYLVMPFVEGGTLRDYLYTRERLTLDEAGSLLEQIASALQYAHNHGVIHCDVKPSNILLRLDGHAYLVDFGLAKAKADADAHPHSGIGIGTPEYMAPEQLDGINDSRSDIYSLGIILYQMLTGRVPFTADSPMAVILKHLQLPPSRPSQINEDITQDIEDIILKSLAKKPEERYQEISDFSSAYKQALLAEHISTQTLPAFASMIIKHSHQEEPENQKVLSPHIGNALSRYPFDISSAKPPVGLSHRLSPMEYKAFSQEKSRKQRAYLFALTLCLLIIIIILPLMLNFLWTTAPISSKKKPADISSTQIAQQQATATAIAQLQIQATLAAQARVQATEDITPPLHAGRILYYNEMTSPGEGWINDGRQCAFSPRGYYISTYTPRTIAWCYSNQQRFSDAIITAQASLIRGDFYGIVFRLNPNSQAFYVLELNNASQYRFQRAQGRDPNRWLTLIDWTSSSAIYAGYGHRNSVLVIANRTHFRFYINKQLIISTFADKAYATGFIGLLVGGDSKKGTEALFNNIMVLQNQTNNI